jgi:hypothetical protein
MKTSPPVHEAGIMKKLREIQARHGYLDANAGAAGQSSVRRCIGFRAVATSSTSASLHQRG